MESQTEDCFVLTRPKNDNEMTTIVPVVTTVNVTGGGTMEGTTVNHVTHFSFRSVRNNSKSSVNITTVYVIST